MTRLIKGRGEAINKLDQEEGERGMKVAEEPHWATGEKRNKRKEKDGCNDTKESVLEVRMQRRSGVNGEARSCARTCIGLRGYIIASIVLDN